MARIDLFVIKNKICIKLESNLKLNQILSSRLDSLAVLNKLNFRLEQCVRKCREHGDEERDQGHCCREGCRGCKEDKGYPTNTHTHTFNKLFLYATTNYIKIFSKINILGHGPPN